MARLPPAPAARAGLGQGVGDAFVEAGLHDADAQPCPFSSEALPFLRANMSLYSLGM
jgi:hypothetical protein